MNIASIQLNWVVILLGLIPLIAYSVLFFKRNTSLASIESNDILRGLLDDQKAEILKLRERQHDTVNEIQLLKLQVQHITDKRDYLEKLVIAALKLKFESEPSTASAVLEGLNTKGANK